MDTWWTWSRQDNRSSILQEKRESNSSTLRISSTLTDTLTPVLTICPSASTWPGLHHWNNTRLNFWNLNRCKFCPVSWSKLHHITVLLIGAGDRKDKMTRRNVFSPVIRTVNYFVAPKNHRNTQSIPFFKTTMSSYIRNVILLPHHMWILCRYTRWRPDPD